MGSGSVRSSNQTVSDYTIRQRLPNTQQSRFLTVLGASKNPFLTRISSLMYGAV